jgi:hypothetical protein
LPNPSLSTQVSKRCSSSVPKCTLYTKFCDDNCLIKSLQLWCLHKLMGEFLQ